MVHSLRHTNLPQLLLSQPSVVSLASDLRSIPNFWRSSCVENCTSSKASGLPLRRSQERQRGVWLVRERHTTLDLDFTPRDGQSHCGRGHQSRGGQSGKKGLFHGFLLRWLDNDFVAVDFQEALFLLWERLSSAIRKHRTFGPRVSHHLLRNTRDDCSRSEYLFHLTPDLIRVRETGHDAAASAARVDTCRCSTRKSKCSNCGNGYGQCRVFHINLVIEFQGAPLDAAVPSEKHTGCK